MRSIEELKSKKIALTFTSAKELRDMLILLGQSPNMVYSPNNAYRLFKYDNHFKRARSYAYSDFYRGKGYEIVPASEFLKTELNYEIY